ncbi:hypothetical protein TUN199_05395 [Pyrenophora tritici-repentis]|nr:hypothetical protein Alg130_08704 [Pyrenophora tritici-repentis]KAI0613237.1 hypothetical protein TUN205_02542 [Pyrenophora tritici-repentis]KAI0622623.1 hypothetical protein TUN199_05395 [Pyrenophora tritici-repentis]KAI1523780.1 hypothetical protein PtrSN001A_011158 [Pyrenophora tritici-repentis]KAI1524237.1 hypothetical protein PtrSN001C_011124 [Pyrenophora tritici-repentis]
MAPSRSRNRRSDIPESSLLEIVKSSSPVNEMEGIKYHPAISQAPEMLQLPNELLETIASHLVPSTVVHTLEGTSVGRYSSLVRQGTRNGRYMLQSWPHIKYLREFSALLNLALVCRRFSSIVERVLYRDISLPTPSLHKVIGFFQYPTSSTARLTRTLIHRPDLAARIKSLRMWIPDRRLVWTANEPNLHPENPYYDVFKIASDQVYRSNLPLLGRTFWGRELERYQEVDLSAFLLCLIPRLESLELMSPYAEFEDLDPRGRHRSPNEKPNYAAFDMALSITDSIKSIYVTSRIPLTMLPSASLTELTLDIMFFAARDDWLATSSVLPNVRTLIVELNVPLLRDMHFGTATRTLAGPRSFLKFMVPNIATIAIEPCKGTDPECAPRFDRWGAMIPEPRMDRDPQDVNETFGMRLIDQYFLNEKLSLPANWYASAGMGVRPMWNLKPFSRLRSLLLPKIAIIANPYAEDYDENEDKRQAVTFLPRSLQELCITQVDVEVCDWLQAGFSQAAQDEYALPSLEKVTLIFRDDLQPALPIGFVHDANEVGVQNGHVTLRIFHDGHEDGMNELVGLCIPSSVNNAAN